MVVLEEHAVEEATAMVHRAADPHRVFLERAQRRRRLSRVENRHRALAASTNRRVSVAMPVRR